MHANDERMCGAVDQQAFEQAIRDNLSPEGVATIIAFLQAATHERPRTEKAAEGLRQMRWFADTLFDMLGAAEYNHQLDELGL